MTDEEKGFHYWLGGPGIAEALNSKDRVKFLNRLKEMYLRTLMELNSVENKLKKEQEEIELKNKEIESLKEINAELTEENMKLTDSLRG